MKHYLWHLLCGALLCVSGPCLATEVAAQVPSGRCTPLRTLEVSVDGSPDQDSSRSGIQVEPGKRVQLSGSSRIVSVRADCTETEALATLNWVLTLQPDGRGEANITSSLGPKTTQTIDSPSTTAFTATTEGTYRAKIRGTASGLPPTTRVVVIHVTASESFPHSCGRLTFLRVSNIGAGFGPPNDFLDAEVVTKLNTQPDRAMGFQLRTDNSEPVRRAMLDMLRDAFRNNTPVCLEYILPDGKKNGRLIRVVFEK